MDQVRIPGPRAIVEKSGLATPVQKGEKKLVHS
jgi:hypothetical protein